MIVLAVSRSAQRGTSGMIEGLASCFTGLEDPRETRRCDHQLVDILAIAVCAVVACAESWEDIELYGRSKRAWLQTFLELPSGIPSHDTFRRVFMLIDPDAFEAGFAAWVGSLAAGFAREVVAIGTVSRLGVRPRWPLVGADRWRLGSAARSRCRACRCRPHSGPGAGGRPRAGTSASAAICSSC